ncbi:glutamate racemase [Verrucomicrobiota bacterium]|nr:glutamate racemase [Verrucomicrobiota bacterium]
MNLPLNPSPNSRPIGIFDSGVGGLTVARQLRRVLPHEDLLYLGDTARVPYGTKSPATVVRFACEDTGFLVGRDVKAVVVACNTASAWALEELQQRFTLPVFGVILPGAAAALRRTRTGRIGVIGTPATIRSEAYTRAILGQRADARVFARACPLLVPLVEEGWVNHRVSRLVLEEYLRPLLRQRIDTLVLGCTHYPLLKRVIRQVVGPDVALIDSAESCARHVAEQLQLRTLLTAHRTAGELRACLTDETTRFTQVARRFLGEPVAPAEKVELAGVD